MNHKTGKIVNCSFCDKETYKSNWKIQHHKNLFCSLQCVNNFKKGSKLSEETLKKISTTLKKSYSNGDRRNLFNEKEWKAGQSDRVKKTFLMGREPTKYWLGKKTWNAGLNKEIDMRIKKQSLERCGSKNPSFGKSPTQETRIKISDRLKGISRSIETRLKQSESKKGEKSYNYKGGIASENEKLRKGIEFRLWRESVFARDNWTCQKCEKRGGEIHPHHIQNFAEYPELRFAIDNGITFCKDCHKEFHKKYGNKKNNGQQINEFLTISQA